MYNKQYTGLLAGFICLRRVPVIAFGEQSYDTSSILKGGQYVGHIKH